MLNRRQLLTGLGGAAAGAVLMVGSRAGAAGWADKHPLPWTPRQLDPEECALAGYQGYYDRGLGCGYGGLVGLLGPMARKYGAPFADFPAEMAGYMAGGAGGWGTLCGSLNGAAAFLGLFWAGKDLVSMMDSLFTWYEQANLPHYQPAQPKLDYQMVHSRSDSTLCHTSAGKWCKASGFAMGSKERAERCARVTADVAQQAALIVNAKLAGKPLAMAASQSRQTCGQCHAPGKEVDDLKGKMDCAPCHDGRLTDMFHGHP